MGTKTFVVTGPRTSFPLDMLRYDNCWPDSEADARMIEYILTAEERESLPRRVSIKLRTEDVRAPTIRRWNGFNWEVR